MATTRSRFYTKEKLSLRRHKTPEGFLLILGCPIARTGEQIYGPEETPVEVGKDNIAIIQREADEVFRPETIASFEGKSLVNNHPDVDVSPENWRDLTLGIVVNVRRGEGADDDLLLGDVLVMDKGGIELVESGKVELSGGYDADYEQFEPGRGRQKNIIGNHVALVDSGRCGPRCSIHDHSSVIKPKELQMSKAKPNLIALATRAFKAKTLDEALEAAEEMPGSQVAGDEAGSGTEHHVHVHVNGGTELGVSPGGPAGSETTVPPAQATNDEDDAPAWFKAHVESNNKRFEALEQAIAAVAKPGAAAATGDEVAEEGEEGLTGDAEIERESREEAPEGTGDMAAKAKDSAFLVDSYQTTLSLAEILCPGVKAKAFDAKAAPKASLGVLHSLRCRALDGAYATPEGRSVIDGLNDGKPLNTKKMTRDAVRVLFRGAANGRKQLNNMGTRDSGIDTRNPVAMTGAPRTPAEFNARAAARRAAKQ